MNQEPTRTTVATLTHYSIVVVGFANLTCRHCGSGLDLHQPNPNQDDRFLGTCTDCGRWCRVEPRGETGCLIVLELPEVGEVAGSLGSGSDCGAPDRDGTG